MSYKVNTVRPITLNETDRTASILQNISMILQTWQQSCPFYREFGMPMNFVDKPLSVARPIILIEVREAIRRFEPRVEVLGVSAEEDMNGIIKPEVEVEILNEESGV